MYNKLPDEIIYKIFDMGNIKCSSCSKIIHPIKLYYKKDLLVNGNRKKHVYYCSKKCYVYMNLYIFNVI